MKAFTVRHFRSPIATRGLDILIDCELRIEASKLKALELYKIIIERNYDSK